MKLKTGKKFRQKLHIKTKQLLAKMLPVEGNVFQTISYSSPENETNIAAHSENETKQTKKSLKDSIKKKMSALLRNKSASDGSHASNIRSAWSEDSGHSRSVSEHNSSQSSQLMDLDCHNTQNKHNKVQTGHNQLFQNHINGLYMHHYVIHVAE